MFESRPKRMQEISASRGQRQNTAETRERSHAAREEWRRMLTAPELPNLTSPTQLRSFPEIGANL